MEVLVVIDFKATRLPSDNFTCWFKSNLCLDLLEVFFADEERFCGWGIIIERVFSGMSLNVNFHWGIYPRIFFLALRAF